MPGVAASPGPGQASAGRGGTKVRRSMSQRPTFLKREREKARRERQAKKTARRAEAAARKAAGPDRPDAADGEDPDIAGIRPGPQPPPEE